MKPNSKSHIYLKFIFPNEHSYEKYVPELPWGIGIFRGGQII